MTLLQATGLSVRFGGLLALDDVSIEVAPGEVLGIIGPNGAGKTTLFNVLCGFVRPSAGEVRWRGEPLRRIRPHRLAGLGIVRTLQGLGLFAGLTVVENVMVGADRHRRSRVPAALLAAPTSDRDEARLRERAMAALQELGAAQWADRLPGALPYGAQKRVALARALVAEPTLLLLDEPASGLSEEGRGELSELLRALRQRTAVMLVEHHMDLVMATCDRIAVLDFGRCIATGTPAEIQGDERVVEAYLGAAVDAATPELGDAAG